MEDLVVFRFSNQGSTNWQASFLPVTALDSFNFYCPIEKTTYKARFDSSSLTSIVETMDVNGNVTSTTMGDIVLVEVLGE